MTPSTVDAFRPVQTDWYLSECSEHEGQPRAVHVTVSPFRIGRLPNLGLSVCSGSVSKTHAELLLEDDALSVRDLGSTNGTFVNGRRISECTRLTENDLLQLANVIFRVGRERQRTPQHTIEDNAGDWAQSLCQFDRLMNQRAVTPHFQPIVELATRNIVGFEALARSALSGLEQPRLMFAVAEKFDQQCELSEMLRVEGVLAGAALANRPAIFVNTHPAEIVTPRLLESIRRLRARFPRQKLVIEIHEAAATDSNALLEFRRMLRELDMQLAFDDFGAGQARLLELTEIAPEFVKFDIDLIRGIDAADSRRQTTLAALVRMVADLGIVTLAEGIETEAEARKCREFGFSLAQGYLFGRPAPALSFATT